MIATTLTDRIHQLSVENEALKETQKELISICLTRQEINSILTNIRVTDKTRNVREKLSNNLKHKYYKSVEET